MRYRQSAALIFFCELYNSALLHDQAVFGTEVTVMDQSEVRVPTNKKARLSPGSASEAITAMPILAFAPRTPHREAL
jgi:hypothetical protein